MGSEAVCILFYDSQEKAARALFILKHQRSQMSRFPQSLILIQAILPFAAIPFIAPWSGCPKCLRHMCRQFLRWSAFMILKTISALLT
jgi:hypothetical protein